MKPLLIIVILFIALKLNAQQPVLYTPANSSTGISVTPTLTFTNPGGSHYHTLEISSNGSFSGSAIVYTKNFVYSPHSVLAGYLSPNHTYYWRVRVVNGKVPFPPSEIWSFTTTSTGILNIASVIPEEFKLYNNYPNPFNPITKIKFDLPKNSFVKINIIDIKGKIVNALVNENLNAGSYEAEFNGTHLSSGVYYYRIETIDFAETKKMILVK